MTYIFDFDGTLVDSMPTFSDVMIRILEENNIVYPKDLVKIITPLGYQGTAEYAISLGIKMTPQAFIDLALQYATSVYHNEILAKPYVKETLEKLKAEGNSLNVLTASPHSLLDKCLSRLGLYSLFDNVWSCDDFPYTKADTKIYEEVAKRLHQEVGACYFVDDNIHAIEIAKKAGMRTIGVFDLSSLDFVEEMKKISDKYILDFREL